MIYLNHTYELLTGGYYSGNSSWNKKRTEIDNCFKLYQLTKGEAVISNENGEEFIIKEGHFYFINGSKLQQQSCKESFATYWLHFIPKDLVIYQMLTSLPLVVEIPAENIRMQEYIPALDKLFLHNDLSQITYSIELLRLQSLLQNIVLEVLTRHPVEHTLPSVDMKRIEPAIKYINRYYKENVPLAVLAKQCCMSANYFHKLFKQALNITPANYQMLLRMNTALEMLSNKKMAVKNIAYELGFSDDAHFNKCFKLHYGITPGEYQKKGHEVLP